MKFLVSTVMFTLLCVVGAPASAGQGKFVGEIVAALADDGRNLILRQPFGYIDSKGQHWDVPAGTETDGASIPQAFWVAYPPFTGKYRRAAVVHDYFCQIKERSWEETHDVFFDAMLSAGVDLKTAKVMWAGVYYMGPRWEVGSTQRGLESNEPSIADQKAVLGRLEKWIAEKNPSQDEIRSAIEGGHLP